jgi:hypothetical protein
LLEFSDQDNGAIIVSPLTVAPPENAILELALYDEYDEFQTNEIDDDIKIRYTFTMNQDAVQASIDDQSFDVINPGDFFEGQLIGIHSDDFTTDNFESKISTIIGNTITVEEVLEFTPQVKRQD